MRISGVLEPSKGPYRNPAFLIKKKNPGEYRLISSVTKQNSETIRDAGLPPNVEEFSERFAGQVISSLMDFFAGYEQVPLAIESRDMTAIETEQGLMRFTVLQQGGTNNVATFVRIVNKILSRCRDISRAFLDDVGVDGPRTKYNNEEAAPGVRKYVLEHIKNLDRVLCDIERSGATISGLKSEFCKSQLKAVGFLCDDKGRHPAPGKIAKICLWKACKTQKEIRAFLGLCVYYRVWIKDFSVVAKPMYRLLKKGVEFCWDEDCDDAMDKLKDALTNAPALSTIDYESAGEIVLSVDASGDGWGAILQQYVDGKRHPIRYESGVWTTPEKNYDAGKRECRALLRALKKLKVWLYGIKFTVEIDAKTLLHQLNLPIVDLPGAMVTRWITWIRLFDFDVRHIPGRQHSGPDGLSRRPADDEEEDDYDEVERCIDSDLGVNRVEEKVWRISLGAREPNEKRVGTPWATTPEKEKGVGENVWRKSLGAREPNEKRVEENVWEIVERRAPEEILGNPGKRAANTPEELSFAATQKRVELETIRSCTVIPTILPALDIADLSQYDDHHRRVIEFLQTLRIPAGIAPGRERFFRLDATQYHVVGGELMRRNTKKKPSRRVICDDNAKKAILIALHEESGHRGRDGTAKKILERYWWRNIYRDTKLHVQSCDECQKRFNVRVEEVLHPNLPSTMWDKVCVDVVHMPKGIGERKFLVVAREDVSGWPEARAIRKANSETVATFLEEDVFARHGCPKTIVVDGGPENKGMVDEICARLHVSKHTVTAYHPQANGLVERGHKQLVDGLSKVCSRSPAKWPNYLNAMLWADRTTVRKSTQYTPFQLIYGRQCLLPIELQLSTWQMLHDTKTVPRTPAELLALRVHQLTAHKSDVDAAVENLKKSRLANKTWFDKNKRLRPETAPINKGDLVLLHDTRLDNQHTDKLADRWGGPYLVKRVLDGGAYVLTELDGSRLEGSYAGNRLKRYWARDPTDENEDAPATNKDKNVDPGDSISEDPASENATENDDDDEEEVETIPRNEPWPLPGKGFFVRVP
jgi:transposase InsO family protein